MTTQRFYYKQNRLKQLRAFCHAVRTLSISKAAERMHLSQPTVSLQIKALEQEMGTVLFERRGPRISLTPEGGALYELASPLVEGMDNLPDAFAERCGNLESGEIHIAAGESTILYLLPGFVEQFAAEYPGIEIRLHNVTGREGLERLRADNVDFAVGAMFDAPSDIIYRPLFTYPTVLITPSDHPLTALDDVTLDDIAPWTHPAAPAPEHLAHRRHRLSAAQGRVQGDHRGRGLGGHQALRGPRTRRVHRVEHLHDRGRPARVDPARYLLPEPHLRRGASAREIPFSGGAAISRDDRPGPRRRKRDRVGRPNSRDIVRHRPADTRRSIRQPD